MVANPISLFHVPTVNVNFSANCDLLHGPEVEALEYTIAHYVGAKYAVSFNSASSALFLIYKYLIDPSYDQKDILIPGMIPPVVPNAIINAGLKPLFSDNYEWVGFYYHTAIGQYILWDCAQYIYRNVYMSLSSTRDNDLMVFSFFPTKPISGCDGGMVVSDNEEAIEKLRMLSMNGYGLNKYKASWMRPLELPGWKMYMSSMQASIIRDNFEGYNNYKIPMLDNVANWYKEHLPEDVEKGKPPRSSRLPLHIYTILVDNNMNFIAYMKKNGIQCGLHYSATCNHPVYAEYRGSMELPVVSKNALRIVSLPYHEKLTELDVKRISHLTERYVETAHKETHV